MRRGDIHVCDFGNPIGHEQGFKRPALIVSADEMTRHGLPIVLPVTRTKRGYPTHVELDGVLSISSYVQCEQLRLVSFNRIGRQLGKVDGVDLARIELILRRILGMT